MFSHSPLFIGEISWHTHGNFSLAVFRTIHCFTRKLVLVLRPPKEAQWMVQVSILKTSHNLSTFVFPLVYFETCKPGQSICYSESYHCHN